MSSKPLIYWVSMPTEVEYDIYRLSKITKKMDIRVCTIGHGKTMHSYGIDINFEPYDSCILDPREQEKMFNRICKENPDLVIKKTGWAAHTVNRPKLFPNVMKRNKIKHCMWTSEQGCLRDWQLDMAKHYDWIIVNNLEDKAWYKKKFKRKKKIDYMPFGCVPEFHCKTRKKDEYKSLVCTYSNPRWDIPCKVDSMNRIVTPLLDFFGPSELALFGKAQWYPDKFKRFFRGEFSYKEFPVVNSSADMVLGITANIENGGYGTKLAKMLSCGAFVLWDYTRGIENEFINHHHLVWSRNAWQTLLLVNYYLDEDYERKRIAQQGQKYAHEYLSYEKNILKLLEGFK